MNLQRIAELFQLTPHDFEQYLKTDINKYIDNIDDSILLEDTNLTNDIKMKFVLTPIELGELIDKEKSEFIENKTEFRNRTYKQQMYRCNFKFFYSGDGILFNLYHNKGGPNSIDEYYYRRITIYDNYFELTVEIENNEDYIQSVKYIISDAKGYLLIMIDNQKDFIDKFNQSLESIITRIIEARRNKIKKQIEKDKEFDEIK